MKNSSKQVNQTLRPLLIEIHIRRPDHYTKPALEAYKEEQKVKNTSLKNCQNSFSSSQLLDVNGGKFSGPIRHKSKV